jgi:N6-L-threonylcarbamoyladenine synthase
LFFSFSGLKTSVINYLKNNTFSEDIIASFQYTLCETLVDRLILAAGIYKVKDIVIGGGVAANKVLRNMLTERAAKTGKKAWVIPVRYCTDNASMIANMARFYGDACDGSENFSKDMFAYKAYSTSRK